MCLAGRIEDSACESLRDLCSFHDLMLLPSIHGHQSHNRRRIRSMGIMQAVLQCVWKYKQDFSSSLQSRIQSCGPSWRLRNVVFLCAQRKIKWDCLCHKTFKKYLSSFGVLYQYRKYYYCLCVLLNNNEYKIVNELNAQWIRKANCKTWTLKIPNSIKIDS